MNFLQQLCLPRQDLVELRLLGRAERFRGLNDPVVVEEEFDSSELSLLLQDHVEIEGRVDSIVVV